jgi:pimeloyl-ACP methyl ester carboxylesterase
MQRRLGIPIRLGAALHDEFERRLEGNGTREVGRLRSLTMIDVVSYDSYPSKRTRQQMAEGLEKLIKKPDEEHRTHVTEWLPSTHSTPTNSDPEALRIYLEFISGPVGQASLFQHQVAHYDPKHTMEVADQLGKLADVPVQLIWGAEDAWQVVAWAYRLNHAISGSELHIMDGCGHFAPEERPAEVAALLVDFLGRAEGRWSISKAGARES